MKFWIFTLGSVTLACSYSAVECFADGRHVLGAMNVLVATGNATLLWAKLHDWFPRVPAEHLLVYVAEDGGPETCLGRFPAGAVGDLQEHYAATRVFATGRVTTFQFRTKGAP